MAKGTMPPAFLAAIERRNAKKKGAKPTGKPNPFAKKGKVDNAAEDKLDGGADDAMESGGMMKPKSNGAMPAGLAKYMAAHHGKK